MKKGILVLGLAIAMIFSARVFAEQEEMMPMGDDFPAGRAGMMTGEGQEKGPGKMMGMMQKDALVATSDGGVVLRSGPRLLKYDAGLNLVNEVEIPRGKKPAPPQEDAAAEPESVSAV